MIKKPEIGGVLLAGGKASRMGFRNKALQLLNGEPLLAHGIRRAQPQVHRLILSVNHNAELYQPFKLPIVADHNDSYRGPLLGIYSAMRWFTHQQEYPSIKYLACFAADVPEFPADIIQDLALALSNSSSSVSYVFHLGQIQPLFSLWHLSLVDTLFDAIDSGLYGPKLLFESLGAVAVHCESSTKGAFFNINSIDDLATAARIIVKK